jgi:N-methylhydantoinase B
MAARSRGTRRAGTFDGIALEILWSRLIAIADEAATALVRTAFSTIVRESNDFSFVLADVTGDSVVENSGGIPSFVGILPRTIRHMLSLRPPRSWRSGDIMITNNPWLATGHLPDATMVSPVFYKGRLVGFAGTVAHLPDIGGAMWAADCHEVFEEGLQIPPMAFMTRGKVNEALLMLIEANTRVPEQVVGDLHAQVAAHQVCAQRLSEFLDDVGIIDFRRLGREIKRRAEMTMRDAIREVPDGTYTGALTADGFDTPVLLHATVTVDGDKIDVDYAGTSSQVAAGINCVLNYTYAYSAYPIKCALDPHTPRNEGSYRPVTVTAPEGTIVNPRFPAAVGARHLIGHMLSSVVFVALAQALPSQVMADSGGALMRAVLSGRGRDGRPFSAIAWPTGGMGAGADRDGLSTTPFPSNVGVGSLEALEAATPLIIWKKEFRVDSGGPGKHRGGLGQDVVLEVRSSEEVRVSLLAERTQHAPIGILGGRSGAPNEIMISDGRRPRPKSRFALAPGQTFTLRYAGGGGYGSPEDRDRQQVREDLRQGMISPEAARQIYRLNLDTETTHPIDETPRTPGSDR